MSEEPPKGNAPIARINVEATTAEDGRSVTLTFTEGGAPVWIMATDTASVEAIIGALGAARGKMLEPVITNMPDGVHPLAAHNPRWYVLPDSTNKFATLWLRHPGLGWSGFGFPRHEAGNIARHLIRTPAITSPEDKLSSLPGNATSLSGDGFLLTTAGLGFYYYGEGDSHIGPDPFEQVEYDSDRAAGIVAGSIIERRLEQALKSIMKKQNKAASDFLFRPSGPLGSFKTKIDLAYLLGLLSDDAYKDLTNLKNIRNDFAHELELDTFDKPTIKDRCANFVLVDRHVGPVPDRSTHEILVQVPTVQPYLGLPDYKEKLANPRFRYVMTAQLLSSALGMASHSPGHELPFV